MLLNWYIFLAPTSIIDYLLAHELVHLKLMSHSKKHTGISYECCYLIMNNEKTGYELAEEL
ncbi:M48 family metallopeptidase [Bacillus sp. AFS002410]|uniref:M48 family metallopeptidase n=1 Tax=Bacillus sp. AFS002410 TaxID=2033481 RepID=UPI0027B994A7|nr:M48 family metallopeptidase [Bacillus sp. AFS002410]